MSSLLDLQNKFPIPPPFTFINVFLNIISYICYIKCWVFNNNQFTLKKANSCSLAQHTDTTIATDYNPDMDVKRKESLCINPLITAKTNPISEMCTFSPLSKISIKHWKSLYYPKAVRRSLSSSQLDDKIKILLSSWTFSASTVTHIQEFEMYLQSENIKKLKIRESQKSWAYLYPNYHPPSYSKPKEAFPVDLQCFVDIATPSNVIEISKKLRYRLITDLFSGPYVTDYDKACFASNGIPLNPSGRCGISGRGLHPKFGINYRAFYCIFKKNPDNGTLYLLTTTHEIGMGLLPFADKYDTISRSDVFLVKLLTSLKVPVKNVQLMSSKSHLSIGQVESNTGHVMYKKMPDQIDTDNAWLEADVYCLNLSHHFSLLSDSHDNFHWTQLTAGTVNVVACNAVHSQFISASLNLLNIG